jgi:hypothetical protein
MRPASRRPERAPISFPHRTHLSKADIFRVFEDFKIHTVDCEEFGGSGFPDVIEAPVLAPCHRVRDEPDRLTNSWRSKNLGNPKIIVP